MYIRALTTDMNELESQKAKSDTEKVRETAKRLSTQFLKLADVVGSNIGIARECVLTAFSLHPTRACYDRIKEMAVACGKTRADGTQSDNSVVVVNERTFKHALVEGNHSSTGSVMMVKRMIDSNSGERKDETARGVTDSPPPTLCNSTSLFSVSPGCPAATGVVTASMKKSSIDFQNGQVSKSFERTDQLLKSLLTAKRGEAAMISGNDRCPLHPRRDPLSSGPLGELCFNCGEFTGSDISSSRSKTPEASSPASPGARNVERTLDALILIKGDAVTGSANYDEKSVPNQVLDAEKLGLSPQLCDDLAVVLSSPRYHMLSWVLDWKELNSLCERYLENAEEMRNTNKELKYLNIDYSQFKDWPSEDDTKDIFFGIEKGYEQWVDLPSDNSEQFGSFQPAGNYKRSSTRRSLDDTTTTDSDSGSVMRIRRTGRQRKIHRLESSESDYDSTERKPKHFRNRVSSISDSDSNTQDSQTDSLGSDGCRLEVKKKAGGNKSSSAGKEAGKKLLSLIHI